MKVIKYIIIYLVTLLFALLQREPCRKEVDQNKDAEVGFI